MSGILSFRITSFVNDSGLMGTTRNSILAVGDRFLGRQNKYLLFNCDIVNFL